MSGSQFDEVAQKIDKHFEKAGVVLVGMHQELQEQKHRIGQYHDKVDAVTSDLARRSDEMVADLRMRAESAAAVLGEAEPVVARIRAMTFEADEAFGAAKERLNSSRDGLAESQARFRTDATDLVASINEKIAAFSGEVNSSFSRFSDQQGEVLAHAKSELANALQEVGASFAASLDRAKASSDAALQSLLTEQMTFLAESQGAFREALMQLDSKLKAHTDAHQKFLKSAYDEVSERQRASDAAFAALKTEVVEHQSRQIEFAKMTRWIVSALVVAGIAVLGALVFARGGGV